MVPSLINTLECRGTSAIKQVFLLLSVSLVFSSTVTACAREEPASQNEVKATLSFSSTAFKEGGEIPVKYTCDGQDISPPFVWFESPQNTQSFALIVDDPDAPSGSFTHWVLYNLPASVHQLEEGITNQEQLKNGAIQGMNDFGRIGYGGPCPPSGPAHEYRFTIYALDKSLTMKPGASKNQLLDAIKGHILAQGRLIGRYQRN